MANASQSRRREPRFPIEMPVTVSIGKRGVEGETRDVSYSGVFIAIDKLPPLRSFIRIQLDLPDGRGSVELSGMVVRHTEPPPDSGQEAGMGIQLYANGDDVLNIWNAYISTIPHAEDIDEEEHNYTDGTDTSPFEQRVDAAIPLKDLTPQELFQIYAIDIPRGLFFLSTENNLAMGDVVLVDLIGENKSEDDESFPLKGRVIAQQREPGNFGVQLDFVDIRTNTLESFWKFICDQTPSRYAPMEFPTLGEETAEEEQSAKGEESTEEEPAAKGEESAEEEQSADSEDSTEGEPTEEESSSDEEPADD